MKQYIKVTKEGYIEASVFTDGKAPKGMELVEEKEQLTGKFYDKENKKYFEAEKEDMPDGGKRLKLLNGKPIKDLTKVTDKLDVKVK